MGVGGGGVGYRQPGSQAVSKACSPHEGNASLLLLHTLYSRVCIPTEMQDGGQAGQAVTHVLNMTFCMVQDWVGHECKGWLLSLAWPTCLPVLTCAYPPALSSAPFVAPCPPLPPAWVQRPLAHHYLLPGCRGSLPTPTSCLGAEAPCPPLPPAWVQRPLKPLPLPTPTSCLGAEAPKTLTLTHPYLLPGCRGRPAAAGRHPRQGVHLASARSLQRVAGHTRA